MPNKTKDKYNIEMKKVKDKIIEYKRKFNDLRSSRNKTTNHNKNSDEASNKLLKISQNLNEGTNVMGETLRTMINVTSTDKDTNLVLKRQTENIQNATNKLNEADAYIGRSDNILRNMLRRVFTNKLVLVGMIILLGLIDAFLFYIKVKYKILDFNK